MSNLFPSVLRYQFGYTHKLSHFKKHRHDGLNEYRSPYYHTLDTEGNYIEGTRSIRYFAMYYCCNGFKRLTKRATKYALSDWNDKED